MDAVGAFREYIMTETLAVELNAGNPPAGAAMITDSFDGEELTLGLIKA